MLSQRIQARPDPGALAHAIEELPGMGPRGLVRLVSSLVSAVQVVSLLPITAEITAVSIFGVDGGITVHFKYLSTARDLAVALGWSDSYQVRQVSENVHHQWTGMVGATPVELLALVRLTTDSPTGGVR